MVLQQRRARGYAQRLLLLVIGLNAVQSRHARRHVPWGECSLFLRDIFPDISAWKVCNAMGNAIEYNRGDGKRFLAHSLLKLFV